MVAQVVEGAPQPTGATRGPRHIERALEGSSATSLRDEVNAGQGSPANDKTSLTSGRRQCQAPAHRPRPETPIAPVLNPATTGVSATSSLPQTLLMS